MYRQRITKYGLFITKDYFYNNLISKVKEMLVNIDNYRLNIDRHSDLLYDLFLARYRDRISRFDNWNAHFDKMVEIFIHNYPTLSRQIEAAQDKEWSDILRRKGYRMRTSTAKTSNAETSRTTNAKVQDTSKSKTSADNQVASTPGDYSSNMIDAMIQSFNKNNSLVDNSGSSLSDSKDISIVDSKGNNLSETEQFDLFNQLIKQANLQLPKIFQNWIVNFDLLFSNFDYQGGIQSCDIKNRYVFNFIYEFITENKDLLTGPKGEKGDKPTRDEVIEWTKFVRKGDKGDKGDQPSQDEVKLVVEKVVYDNYDQLRGPKGERGEQGFRGFPGPKGDKGEKPTKEEIIEYTKDVKKGDTGPQGPPGTLGDFVKKRDSGSAWDKMDKLPLDMNQSRISELADSEIDDDAANIRMVNKLIEKDENRLLDRWALRMHLVNKLPTQDDPDYLKFSKAIDKLFRIFEKLGEGVDLVWYLPSLGVQGAGETESPAFILYTTAMTTRPRFHLELTSERYFLNIRIGGGDGPVKEIEYPLYIKGPKPATYNYCWVYIYKKFRPEKIIDYATIEL